MFVGRVSPFDTKDKREIPEAVRIPNLFTDLVPSPFLLHQQFRVVSAVPSEALFCETRVCIEGVGGRCRTNISASRPTKGIDHKHIRMPLHQENEK